jgi:hypothetical protein
VIRVEQKEPRSDQIAHARGSKVCDGETFCLAYGVRNVAAGILEADDSFRSLKVSDNTSILQPRQRRHYRANPQPAYIFAACTAREAGCILGATPPNGVYLALASSGKYRNESEDR